MDKEKSFTKSNCHKKHKGEKVSSVALSITYRIPPRISLWCSLFRKAKILTLDMGLSQFEAKKSVEEAVVEEEKRFLTEKDSVEDS